MIRTIINKAIKAVLDELFLDAPSVNLSMGADLFSDSRIDLSNLQFRPDIFDISLQPFSLVAGHVGSLNVEGIAEVALGGQLKFQAENIFLLFRLDSIADPEKVQTMKKILIELQSGKFSSVLLTDLLRKLQGLNLPPDGDIKEKRKVIYRTFDFMSKGVHLTIKGIHIRFEFQDENLMHNKCNSLGIMIPLIKVSPSPSSMRPDGLTKFDPAWLIAIKGFQLYVDYNRSSYEGKTFDKTVEFFKTYWRTEVHTVMLSPLDIDVVLGINIKRASGLICPHIVINMPSIKISVDEKQVQILRSIVLQLGKATKKFQQHVAIQKIFRKGFPLPRMYEVGGIRFLPHLMLRGQPYPSKTDIPIGTERPSLVAFMKDRVGGQWKLMLWKFAIRSVMHDLQMTRPLGRWVEIIRLLFIRRDYAFTYAKLLKRSSNTGNFIFNVNANTVSANAMRQLFEYEMILSIQAVHMFRTLAYFVAIVGYQHMKRRGFSSKPTPTTETLSQPWEKMSITWRDILLMYIELYETQRESDFHRFDRSGQDDDVDDYYFVGADDTVSTRNTGGSSGGSGSDLSTAERRRSGVPSAAAASNASAAASSSTIFGRLGGGGTSGATSAATAATSSSSSTSKSWLGMFSGWTSSSSSSAADDEYDKSFMKKFDLSAFGDALGGIVETVDRARGDGSDSTALFSSQVEAVIKGTTRLPNTKHPSANHISEAVQWAIHKHKSSVTVMPPDVSVKVDKLVVEVKTPSTMQQKERLPLLNATVEGIQVTVNVSQSSSTVKASDIEAAAQQQHKKQVRGFSSLTGALVQFRLVTRQFSLAVAVPVAQSATASAAPAITAATATSGGGGGGEVKRSASNTTLSSQDDESVVSSVTTSTTATATVAAAPVPATAPAAPAVSFKTPEKSLQKPQSTNAVAKPAAETVGLGTPPRTEQINHHHRGPYTINTPIDDTLGVVRSQALDSRGGGGGRKELREIISSAPAENVFVFCVILDLDDRGEGAGDIQVQLGGMRMDFSRRTLTALYDPIIAETFQRIASDYEVLNRLLPFVSMEERSLIVDWEEALPYVILACDPPLSVLNRLVAQMDAQRRRQTREEQEIPVATSSASNSRKSSRQSLTSSSSKQQQTSQKPPVGGSKLSRKEEAEQAALKAVMIDDLSHIDHDLEQQNVTFLDHTLHLETDLSRIQEEHSSSSGDEQDDALLGQMAGEQEQSPIIPMKNTDFGEDNSDLEEEEIDDVEEEDDEGEGESTGALTLEERKSRRAAVVFNKNLMHWLGTMESVLPRVLTVCVRTSPIVLQSLEAMVIRDLVYAKIHAVLDQAAQRHQSRHRQQSRHRFFGASASASSMFSLDSVWGILGHLVMATAENVRDTRPRGYTTYTGVRKWGAKKQPVGSVRVRDESSASVNATTTSLSSFKIKALIPAVEVVVAKALVPYPAVDVHVQGMAVLKVPMSDETLCHYLAWLLAECCPVHTL